MKGTTLAPMSEQREMMVTQRRPYPHTAIGGEPAPPRTWRRASAPWHDNHHLGERGGGDRAATRKVWMDISKGNKRKKSETSREGERNRKFVSDSSLMKFSFINSEEMERNLRWPWNSVAPAPTAFGGPSHTCQLV